MLVVVGRRCCARDATGEGRYNGVGRGGWEGRGPTLEVCSSGWLSLLATDTSDRARLVR